MSTHGLVANYSSSEESSDSDFQPKRSKREKRCTNNSNKRLPLPNLFLKKEEEPVDDARKHGGRVRSFPHERGNWSTFVYIHYSPTENFILLLNKLQERCISLCEFNKIEDFHLSLSRTFVLKFHWITNFISSLRTSLCTIERFMITFDSLNVYCNDEKTRTFVGLKVGLIGRKELTDVVKKIDSLLDEFKLKKFYEDPSFHVSLLWCLGNKSKELTELIPSLLEIFHNTLSKSTSHEQSFCDIQNGEQ